METKYQYSHTDHVLLAAQAIQRDYFQGDGRIERACSEIIVPQQGNPILPTSEERREQSQQVFTDLLRLLAIAASNILDGNDSIEVCTVRDSKGSALEYDCGTCYVIVLQTGP